MISISTIQEEFPALKILEKQDVDCTQEIELILTTG